MAVVNARKDMNSDVAALYIEALNEVTNIHPDRTAAVVGTATATRNAVNRRQADKNAQAYAHRRCP